MNLNLKNYNVLVTGSTSGIGKAIAEGFLLEGSCVCLTGRDENRLDAMLQEYQTSLSFRKSIGKVVDFTVPNQINELAKLVEAEWGHLDILVCNVGSGRSSLPLQETTEEWQRILSLNLLTATNAIEMFLPLLRKSKLYANIVLVSSICGWEALGAPITYSVAKAGINSLSKNLSRALGKEQIRVNAVSPGNIMFKGSIWEKKLAEEPKVVRKMLKNEVPLRKMGGLQDIVSAVLFLASERAGFITGANLLVDGGQTRG